MTKLQKRRHRRKKRKTISEWRKARSRIPIPVWSFLPRNW